MAQAPRDSGGDVNANFVRQIVTDPKNVPDVMLLNGYLGASSEEGHERLYLSPDLSSYVEIPAAAILHRAAMPKEQDANGGVTLWVRKDAALQYKLAPAAQALANYFAGAIQAAQGAVGGGPAGAAITVGACAGVATANCTLRCPTEITPCINTHANTCFCPVTHGCPTQNQLCQSQGQCTWIGCGHTLACTVGLLCAAAAPAAGPAAASANCTLRCATEITPCINTHANTCYCPVTHGCPTQNQLCQSQGQCTWIGCGHTLACTYGLLCAGPAPAAATANCTLRCATEITPCINTHANTCYCPVTHACPTQNQLCQSQGQCTYIGCGHTLACTFGLLCNAAAAAGAQFVRPPITWGCPQPTADCYTLRCDTEQLGQVAQVSLACPQQSLGCDGFPGQQGNVLQAQAFQKAAGGANVSGWWFCQAPSLFCTNPAVCRPHTANTPCCPM